MKPLNIRTWLRASGRALHLIWHLLQGLLQALLLRRRLQENWHQTKQGKQAIKQWMKGLCQILGLQVAAKFKAANTPVMLVANHVSWLDIIAIGSLIPTRFVAKDEVRRWPLIGALSRLGGTLFIQRHSSRAARETTRQLSQALANKDCIVVFAEGTTSDGRTVLPFKPALFEASRIANCAVQPLAIRYWRDNSLDTIAPYIEDDNFVVHLWRVLCAPQTQIDLHFCPAIESNAPRRSLATFCHMIISTELINNYPAQAATREANTTAAFEQAA